MRSLRRTYLLAGLLAVAIALLAGDPAQGQGKKGKGNFTPETIETQDGVKLSASYYPSAKGQAKAVVLLLHNFDLKKGGSSTQDGWGDLAADLQKNGYAVLAFDFRGFGGSTDIDPVKFWARQNAHNGPANIYRRGAAPRTIDHKDFKVTYLPYLANDIAAAKAWLDNKDGTDINTANLIVIGAGDGATLGAMWLANQCRLYRDLNPPPPPPVGIPAPPRQPGRLGTPEIRDVTGAIWLSISPKLGTRVMNAPLNRWLIEAGRTNKAHQVPMCFFYGAKDAQGDQVANKLVKTIVPDKKWANALPSTLAKKVPETRLSGSQLLDGDLETGKLIVKYIEHLTDKPARKVAKRKAAESPYFVVHPGSRFAILVKDVSDEVPRVDVPGLLR